MRADNCRLEGNHLVQYTENQNAISVIFFKFMVRQSHLKNQNLEIKPSNIAKKCCFNGPPKTMNKLSELRN